MSYRYTRQVPPPPPPDIQDDGWEFAMDESVQLTLTGETGFVIDRAEELYCEDEYEVLYVNAMGCLTRQWWPESAIEHVTLQS